MNRLQKKCAIAAIGLHLLLAVMMVVGSAFLSASGRVDDSPILNLVPTEAIDGNAFGGGNPGARSPQPVEQIPQPQPQPQQTVMPPVQQPKPEPVKLAQPQPPKNVKPSPDPVEPIKDNKHKVVVN